MKSILLVNLLSIILACGDEGSDSNTYEYPEYKPVDYDPYDDEYWEEYDKTMEELNSRDYSDTEEEEYEWTEADDPVIDEPVAIKDMCLSGCSVPTEIAVDLTKSIVEVPFNQCTIHKMVPFKVDTSYALILNADCGIGRQIYHLSMTSDYALIEEPILISQPCADNYWDVKDLSVEQNDNRKVLASYTCHNNNTKYDNLFASSFDLKAKTLAGYHHISNVRNYSKVYSNYTPTITWNQAAGNYLLTTEYSSYLVSSDAELLSGAIETDFSKKRNVFAYKSSWFISEPESYYNYCNKMHSSGTMLCTDVEVDYEIIVPFNELYAYAIEDEQMDIIPFNVDNCLTGSVRGSKKLRHNFGKIAYTMDLGNDFHAFIHYDDDYFSDAENILSIFRYLGGTLEYWQYSIMDQSYFDSVEDSVGFISEGKSLKIFAQNNGKIYIKELVFGSK